MSITDELREELAICVQNNWMTTATRKEFLAIADRIDAAHNRALMEIRNRAIDQGFDEGFASADDWFAQHEDAMAEHGWVRLPVDADGEPIHVRDKVVEVDEPAVPRTVTSINLAGDGWWVYINGVGRRSDKYRHYHAPTVEDVLTELTDEVWNRCCVGMTASDSGISGLVAEYAAKLRLREDE